MDINADISYLGKNIDCVKSYNSGLVKKILAVKELSEVVEFINSASGDPVFSYKGIVLDDEIDPVDMANQLFYRLGENHETNVYFVFGLGLGYVFKKFAKSCKGKIILFEPNIDILRLVFELVDFSEELSNKNVFVVNSVDEFQELINKKLNITYGTKILTGILEAYSLMYTNLLQGLLKEFERINHTEEIEGTFKVNIGAGNWKKEGWKTLDCYIDADVKADLRQCKPLPIKDNRLEKVFSSHCIEHIENHHLAYLAKELYRCMKPGAILRLVCPDADLALEAYKNNNIEWFNGIYTHGGIGARLVNTFVSYEANETGPQVSEEEVQQKFSTLPKDEFIDWAVSLCDRNRPYIAHINGIYYEKLEKILKEAGFINIEKSSYLNSRDEELRGKEFDRHPIVSLFAECYKPE